MSLKLSINVLDKLKKQKSSRQNDFEEYVKQEHKDKKNKKSEI